MLATLLIPLCVVTPPQAAPAGGVAGKLRVTAAEAARADIRSGRTSDGELEFATIVGGAFSNPFDATTLYAGTPWPRVFQIQINNTGTGWVEVFHLAIPIQPLNPAPLLVAFHGASASQNDIGYNTDYYQKAMARGWYVIAPLGAHEWNFGVPYAQANIEVALDWVVEHFNIDPDRVYGVGFSMGGGVAASYAARHLDPAHVRLAAIVNHTGTTSLRDTYNHWPLGVMNVLEHTLMFGGSPTDFPFAYQQVSTIDLDSPAYPGAVDPTADMSRNLTNVPVMIFASPNDPNGYLVDQSLHIYDHLVGLHADPLLRLGAGTVHQWGTINSNLVLNYLEPFVRTDPPLGIPVQTLADRDGTWWHFTITQVTQGQFTPFRWRSDPASNELFLSETENLAQIRFLPSDLGLDAGQALQFRLGTLSGNPLVVVLEGYPQSPSSVLRAGSSNVNWTWDAQAQTLSFVEADGVNTPIWSVIP
ncbi:MAG: hypothetical protein E2O39_12640 [Planctomycetota bacterium]|nr:MAG: hypothetical protein E2O39_12640 [Planctomycetota bacterium]